MTKSIFPKVGTAAALMLAALPAQAASLIINGSFEDGPPLNADHYYRGPIAPTGWQPVGILEKPDIIGNDYGQGGVPGFQVLLDAQHGGRFLDMNGAGPFGALSQTVNGLTPGAAYTLGFWSGRWAQNTTGTLTAQIFDAGTNALLGATIYSVPYNPLSAPEGWDFVDLTVTAPASGSARIQFSGNSGSSAFAAPSLDNVSFNAVRAAVPEPATWAMLIMGFGLIGGAMRRRNATVRRPAIA